MPKRFSNRKFPNRGVVMCRMTAAMFLCLCTCLWAGCAINPITGEEQLMLISEQQDIEIGRRYAPEVEKQLGGAIEDEQLQNYIDYVGQKIAHVSHQRGFEYHFTAVKDESINAMALPGGYVFITKGMLEKLESEAQLAAILAHEVVHVVARHSSAAMSREIGISVLLSTVTAESTPEGVLVAADLARQILGLKYSRGDERQADLGGLDYMVWAGYRPYAMVEVMQMLHSQPQDRPPEFFSTHPNPENRIGYITHKINTKYYGLDGLKVAEEDYRKAVLDRLEE